MCVLLLCGILCVLIFASASAYVVTEDEVTFYLHTRDSSEVQIRNSTFKEIDGRKNFSFIIHGWQASHNRTYVGDMTTAFLEKEDLNVIQVDWSQPAAVEDHDIAANNTKGVGYFVGQLILRLFKELSTGPNQIHVVGHSLGAHVAGFAGKEVKKHAPRIYRISGLDPARSPFENSTVSNEDRLYREDAIVVFVIHTDRGARGFVESIGTIDFFPNNGTSPQPGCENSEDGEDLCSHKRAYEFFTESIKNPNGFVSTLCLSYEDYENESCAFNYNATLGGEQVDYLDGNYYFNTNAEPPYSKE